MSVVFGNSSGFSIEAVDAFGFSVDALDFDFSPFEGVLDGPSRLWSGGVV
jgi:hypothetical protein